MNSHSVFNRAAGAIILLMLSSAAPVNAQGLLYTVDSTGDGGNVGTSFLCDDGTGHCTLRAALEAANAHPGTDGIRFSIPVSDPGYNGVFWTINLTRVLPDVSDSVGIVGPGANLLTVRGEEGGSGGQYRIFNVTTTGVVTFSKMTISNGFGGIQNLRAGTVNVTNCTLSENRTDASGGGIGNAGTGTVNVSNCTLSENRAGESGGGGIGNLGRGTVNVTNSTISGNSAFGGGGIDNGGTANGRGTVNVTNSTISGNLSFGNNGTPNGVGGIHNSSNGTVTVKSSIIALNTGSNSDVGGSFASGGFNLIGLRFGSAGFTRSTDQGTFESLLNPKLDPNGLQDNGGPTKTIALRSDSSAIDKGTSVGLSGPLATDQRGATFPRTIDIPNSANAAGGDGTDIGAFEFPMLMMDSVVKLPNGHILLRGVGIPNRQHTIQASRNLGPNPASFIAIATPTADETGALQYDDAAALVLEKRFYRLTFP